MDQFENFFLCYPELLNSTSALVNFEGRFLSSHFWGLYNFLYHLGIVDLKIC
jgi:hypothetical protein